MLAVDRRGTRLGLLRWGLVPQWAEDPQVGNRMINARSETLGEKPAYKPLFRKKRCIIPMDGFYEWKAGLPDGPLNAKGKPLKQPMFISRLDGERALHRQQTSEEHGHPEQARRRPLKQRLVRIEREREDDEHQQGERSDLIRGDS